MEITMFATSIALTLFALAPATQPNNDNAESHKCTEYIKAFSAVVDQTGGDFSAIWRLVDAVEPMIAIPPTPAMYPAATAAAPTTSTTSTTSTTPTTPTTPKDQAVKNLREEGKKLDEKEKEGEEACRRLIAVNALITTKTTSGATDLVKAMGEVVLDKATQAGWELMRTELLRLSGCGIRRVGCDQSKAPIMERTYKVLEHSRLQDLVAQPELLINAILSDWFERTTGDEAKLKLMGSWLAGIDIKKFIVAWRSNGRKGLENTAMRVFGDALKRATEQVDCTKLTTVVEKSLWAASSCMSAPGIKACEKKLEKCWPATDDGTTKVKAEILSVLQAHDDLFTTSKKNAGRDALNLLFELGKVSAEDDLKKHLEGMQGVLIGVLDQDWTRVTNAALALLQQVLEAKFPKAACKGDKDCYELKGVGKLISFLAGIGRYAASYEPGNEETAAKARKDAIADLVSRMSSRRERTRGLVVSLGGSLGFVGGVRGEIGPGRTKDTALASPVHLGLGLGFDSYHRQNNWKAFGLHGELTVLDLGQYVAFENKALTLKEPVLAAALAPSVKLGFRLALRETPLFLGVFAGLNPFLRTEKPIDPVTQLRPSGNMTYTIGLMLGVYVPFLDFN